MSNKTTPKYSESLKDLAKRDPFFARAVHNAFAELVIKTKKQVKINFAYLLVVISSMSMTQGLNFHVLGASIKDV